ncbi:MAG: hypothetical protein HY975_00970 [Candidatus Kerfeldbacteria bacterium]|nr:hypothetical protein [Candidatus Kerfeldbacteria bacterium]
MRGHPVSKGITLTLLATVLLATIAVASVRSPQKTGPIQSMITSEVVINTVDAAAQFNQMKYPKASFTTDVFAQELTSVSAATGGQFPLIRDDDVFVPGVTNSCDKAAAAHSAQINIASNDTATMKPTNGTNHRMRAARPTADHTAGLQTNSNQTDESGMGRDKNTA